MKERGAPPPHSVGHPALYSRRVKVRELSPKLTSQPAVPPGIPERGLCPNGFFEGAPRLPKTTREHSPAQVSREGQLLANNDL